MRRSIMSVLLLVIAGSPAFALSDKPYTTLEQIDGVVLLPPAPSPDSAVQKQDLAAVLATQKSRTPELIKRAETDRDFQGFCHGPWFPVHHRGHSYNGGFYPQGHRRNQCHGRPRERLLAAAASVHLQQGRTARR